MNDCENANKMITKGEMAAMIRKLFELGHGMAEADYAWYKELPVLLPGDHIWPEPR
jgi:hypothetical protein